MPEIDIELKNILEESHQERSIKKGHATVDNSPHSDKLKRLGLARKLMGKENVDAAALEVGYFYLKLGKF